MGEEEKDPLYPVYVDDVQVGEVEVPEPIPWVPIALLILMVVIGLPIAIILWGRR